MSRPIPLAVAAFVALLTLSGCAGGTPAPATDASSAPTATTTPLPRPVDPLATVSTLVIRPDALHLVDQAGGVVAEFGYLSDASAAVDALTVVFGSEPVDEDYSGNSHNPPSTAHRWGGFELWEVRYVDNWADVEPAEASFYLPEFRVQFTEPEALGVSLTDVGGHQVGGSWADLTADPAIQTNPSGCSGPYLDFISQPEVWADGSEHVQKISVDFRPDDDEVSIARIGAPMSVHEDGCA